MLLQIFEGPEDLDITSLGECSHALVGQTLAALPGYPRQTLERCNAFFANYRSPSEYLAALKEHPEYDERLRQNSLVRADWRSEEGRVAAEKVRAIERGLGTRYAVARFLFSQWNPVSSHHAFTRLRWHAGVYVRLFLHRTWGDLRAEVLHVFRQCFYLLTDRSE